MRKKFVEKISEWRNKYHKSQQKFADLCGVGLTTVQRWESGKPIRGENIGTVLNIMKKLSGDNDFSEEDFLIGVDEYERRRRAREERELNNQPPQEVKAVPYDLTRFSKVFPLSRLTRPITKLSPAPLGWTPVHQMKENPLQWINVYVDRESGGGCGIPYGREVAVYLCVEGDTDSMPQAVDIVLVYNKSEGSRFIEWKETTAVGDFDTVHGVAAIDEEWIVR